MYVVVVLFQVKDEMTSAFQEAVLQQAKNSLEKEDDCLQFDVSVDPDQPSKFLLYEIYRNEEAFQTHLQSEHFQHFNQVTQDWIHTKSVTTWNRYAI